MITRKSLADEIDVYDQSIADLNDSKKDCFDAYRDQLFASGMLKENVRKEIVAVKAAIRRRRAVQKNEIEVEEKDALIDEIFEEINQRSRASRATRVENIEEFPANAKLVATVANAVQTEAGRKALIAAVDIMIEREAGEYVDPETGEITTVSLDGVGQEAPSSTSINEPANPVATATNVGGDDVDSSALRASSAVEVGATNSPETANTMDDDAIAAVKDQVRLANANGVEPLSFNPTTEITPDPHTLGAADGQRSIHSSSPAGAKSDGSHVIVGRGRESGCNHTGSEEEQAVTNFEPPAFLVKDQAAKSIRDYRPQCQKPDACGASGLKHCYSCSKLMAPESEVA